MNIRKSFYCEGSTLVEALIALLTVSIGALAISDLQAKLVGSTTIVDQKA